MMRTIVALVAAMACGGSARPARSESTPPPTVTKQGAPSPQSPPPGEKIVERPPFAWPAPRNPVEVRIEEALNLYQRQDRAGIRHWIDRPITTRAERVFGAALLIALGDESARRLFVAEFPTDQTGFSEVYHLSFSCMHLRPVGYCDDLDAFGLITKAAISKWPGAAGRFGRAVDLADASIAEFFCDSTPDVLVALGEQEFVEIAGANWKRQLSCLKCWWGDDEQQRVLKALSSRRFTNTRAERLRKWFVSTLRNPYDCQGWP